MDLSEQTLSTLGLHRLLLMGASKLEVGTVRAVSAKVTVERDGGRRELGSDEPKNGRVEVKVRCA